MSCNSFNLNLAFNSYRSSSPLIARMSSTTDKIKANQQRLHAARNQAGLKKWKNGKGGKANGEDKSVKRYESYRREEQLPRHVEDRRVS